VRALFLQVRRLPCVAVVSCHVPYSRITSGTLLHMLPMNWIRIALVSS
jgi:hypothetical protein